MSELSKAYEAASVEPRWYEFWLTEKCFEADPHSSKPAYSIVIPPPNVTGILTMGHVLNNAIQDILARKARMEGREVLWLPGTDHAGIATQTVVEKTLRKEKVMKHRSDLGREKLVAKIWEWKEKHGGIIIQQLKKLGCSCDWSRERFTMDEEYSRAVLHVFVELYKKDHVYRGRKMVNWCPATQTTLSDEEVIPKETQGFLYHFNVEVAEQPGKFLAIATTRPETIMGDTAVAVNPKDERYKSLIGKHAIRPLPAELPREKKLIPIIADDYIDTEFGTGVLKVTPAHDAADYEIGLRHQLPILEVIGPDGKMLETAGRDFAGIDRAEARKLAVTQLKEMGALVKEQPYVNNVGFSERADVPIEPRLSEQWFLKYPQVEKSMKAVETGAIQFHPERWTKTYTHWLSNIRDWAISRQLWWGHRIPVWYRGKEIHCGLTPPQGEGWEQDTDVLDTWFSSWLWPFATMGNVETWRSEGKAKSETLNKFYPTVDLVTGPDIIFFWVARMIMAGYEFMGDKPFSNVYFTGIIRDAQGRKMSKSLGNSPDPLDLIARFGADGLRYGLMLIAPQGQDILFSEDRMEVGRNFANKLWNAARYRQMQGGETEGELKPHLLSASDQYILLKLHETIRGVSESLANYRFNEAAQTLYHFFWGDYCDWYIEVTKPVFASDDPERKVNTLTVMDTVLSSTLRLLHPYMPFITEELFQALKYSNGQAGRNGSIMFAPWPKPFSEDECKYLGLNSAVAGLIDQEREIIAAGRNLRREQNLQPSKVVKFWIVPSSQEFSNHLQNEIETLKKFLGAEQVTLQATDQIAGVDRRFLASALLPIGTIILSMEGLVDVEAEKKRISGQVQKLTIEREAVEKKLSNEGFVARAPQDVVAKERERLSELTQRIQKLQEQLTALK